VARQVASRARRIGARSHEPRSSRIPIGWQRSRSACSTDDGPPTSSTRRSFDGLVSLAGVDLGTTARAKTWLVGAGIALRALDDGVVLVRRLGSSLVAAAPHAERIAASRIALLDDLPARQRAAAARGRVDGVRRRRGHLGDTAGEAQQEGRSQHASTIRQHTPRVSRAVSRCRAPDFYRKDAARSPSRTARYTTLSWMVPTPSTPPSSTSPRCTAPTPAGVPV
jgi:hypothetical protein